MEYNTGNLEKYGTRNPLKRVMIKMFMQRLLRVVGELKAKGAASLLDAGCGEGMVANFLYDNVDGLKITAVDYFFEAIKKAEAENGRDICFKKGDITALSYQDKSFDIVMATEVLEHLEKPEKALSELMRTAKKAVVLSVPNEPFFCLGNLISLKNVRRLGNPEDHINHWTHNGFKRFLTSNEEIRACNIKMYNCLVWTLAVIEKNG